MAKRLFKKIKIKFPRLTLIIVSLLLATLVSSVSSFYMLFQDRVYPGIYLADLNIGGRTKPEILNLAKGYFSGRANTKLHFNYNGNDFTLDLTSVPSYLDLESSYNSAFDYGHSKFYFSPQRVRLSMKSDPALEEQLKQISSQIEKQAIDSRLTLIDGNIDATTSYDGLTLDQESIKQDILNYLETGSYQNNTLPTKVVFPSFSYNDALKAKSALETIKLSPVKLYFKDQSFYLDLDTTFSLINSASLSLNQDKLREYIQGLADQINQDVKEPIFDYDPSGNNGLGRVTNFQAPTEGRSLNIDKTVALLNQQLLQASTKAIELPVDTIEPKNKLVNDLGIKELLSEGISNFAGSIPNRIYNISLTAQKLNGVLVPPGQVFSFDQTVGDITAATGYKQAYVIKEGRTVLDDGGGVCQDSTTLFRAALKAGLPIIDRTAHAYRVGYYEQGFPPGQDATVFYPSVDFKFKNDTTAYVLIQAYTYGTTLYIDLFGSSDGRKAEISNSVISNQVPPPSDLRQDDPTLPKGVVKQVDFSAWGADVYFTRTVSRNGQELANETWRSYYKPWQAVYLVGTGG